MQPAPKLDPVRDYQIAREWYEALARVASEWAQTRPGAAHGMMAATLHLAARLGKGIGMRTRDFREFADSVFRGLEP